jgi:putative lipoprotein
VSRPTVGPGDEETGVSVPAREVRGAVRFLDAVPGSATVHVRLEDVSRADAPSTLVAELVVPLRVSLAAGTTLPFAVIAPHVDDRARYAVRVHVDVLGTGDVTAGDLLSTTGYPVLQPGRTDHVTVEVHRI